MRRLDLVAPITATVLVLLTPIGAQPNSAVAPLERDAGEASSVVYLVVDGTGELDHLVAAGVDLDHHVSRLDSGIVVHAILTPTEPAALRAAGVGPDEVLGHDPPLVQRHYEGDPATGERPGYR